MIFAVWLLAVAPALAQAQTAASRLMLAAVTDPRGHTVVDIGSDDFVVQEGTAAREILSVRVADYPIVVLLDANAASPDDFASIQAAAAHFIERLGNDRPVIVAMSGAPPRMLATFDDERATVLERLRALPPPTPTPASSFDAVALAAKTLHATGTLFASVVVLSSTPNATNATPSADAMAGIIESNAIIHVVALDSEPRTQNQEPRTALRAIAAQTRGEFTPIYAAASFQAALDRLVDRLGTEMLIEYLVPPGSKPVDAKIGIRVPGARVRGLGVAPK